MKFINYRQSPEVALFVEQTSLPDMAADEVLIKVKSSGVNRADTLQRQGKYPPPKGESDILGLEVSGVIEQIGAEVSHWQVGDKVIALVPGGGYAEYCKVKASHLLKLPDSLSFTEGAACTEVFLTAYQALVQLGQLKSGQCVLIHAGASGVGSAAIQLAKSLGATVITTASTEAKLQLCTTLGADVVINYKEQDFVRVVKDKLPTGVNLIVDFISGDYLNCNISCAAMDGKVIILAMLGGRFSEVDNAKLLAKRVQIIPSTLRNRSDEYKSQLIDAFASQFYPLLDAGKIKPVIDSVYDWSEADIAHRRLEANDSMGKFVLQTPME